MPPTHIFFDMHGTLADSARLSEIYARTLGAYMAQHYGGEAQAWSAANRRILADWANYQADLDLSGDEGFEDYDELLIRTTRAMFRLVDIAEPAPADLRRLAWDLGGIAAGGGNALYPDAHTVIPALAQRGYHLGVATHSPASQARATLQGAGVRDYFHAPIIGTDSVERFEKDAVYWRKVAQVALISPDQMLVVDDHPANCQWAKQAGCISVYLQRAGKPPAPSGIDHSLPENLLPLLNLLD